MTARELDLAAWCAERARRFREREHVEMAAYPTPDARDVALVEWVIRTLGNAELAESRRVLEVLVERHRVLPPPDNADAVDLDALDALIADASDPDAEDGGQAVARLVAAARTALPALVAELRTLRLRLDIAQSERDLYLDQAARATLARDDLAERVATLRQIAQEAAALADRPVDTHPIPETTRED